ncbi:putative FAD-binding protein C12C2.03c [Dirofilaria immitis]
MRSSNITFSVILMWYICYQAQSLNMQISDSLIEKSAQKTEFVRTAWSAATYSKLRIYNTIPHRFECFSCMSLSYQERWEHLQYIYTSPKIFTNRCNDPQLSNHIPTVICSTMCVNLLEADVEAGVFIGFKFIRGCMDRVLRNGFNETAIRTHRFQTVNQCRSLPRAHLYNLDRRQLHPVFGDVQLFTI